MWIDMIIQQNYMPIIENICIGIFEKFLSKIVKYRLHYIDCKSRTELNKYIFAATKHKLQAANELRPPYFLS